MVKIECSKRVAEDGLDKKIQKMYRDISYYEDLRKLSPQVGTICLAGAPDCN